jgi:16S rRNA (adenine1518-N6/adenine1519-N6)-dimethyltransferase
MTSPRELLTGWNIRAKRKLGQVFLADKNIANRIVAGADVDADSIVLEIGAGTGALTLPIARAAGKVYAVEKDAQLAELLSTELLVNRISNVEIVRRDFLALNLHAVAAQHSLPLLVMGNLPYNISSQILVKLIRCRELVSRAVLMFQRELAQRLTARPGGRDYGRLTVMLRYSGEVRSLTVVPATAFFPKPQIDSEVLEIEFTPPGSRPVADEHFLFDVIKAAFGRRRKTLKNALVGSQLNIGKDIVLEALSQTGIEPSRRAETLTVNEYVALANSLLLLIGPQP